jgi:hypothetical protein
MTFQFDYWSVYSECLAFVLVLTGNVPLGLLGVVIGATTKNTALILPLIFLAVNQTWAAAGVALVCYTTFIVVREYQGKVRRYHPMRNPINLAFCYIWKGEGRRRFILLGWGVIVVSLIVFTHYRHMPEPYRSTAWVLPVMCAATFFCALVHEPRIMAVNVIWWMSLLLESA